MAQVTYRGVKYDTDTRKAKQTQKVEETYRGVKFQKELVSAQRKRKEGVYLPPFLLYNILERRILMRDQLIKALLAHAQGDIQKHVANVEVYLNNPVGIGEHSNVVEAMEEELNTIAKYQDQIDVINKYFKHK